MQGGLLTAAGHRAVQACRLSDEALFALQARAPLFLRSCTTALAPDCHRQQVTRPGKPLKVEVCSSICRCEASLSCCIKLDLPCLMLVCLAYAHIRLGIRYMFALLIRVLVPYMPLRRDIAESWPFACNCVIYARWMHSTSDFTELPQVPSPSGGCTSYVHDHMFMRISSLAG